MVSFAAEKFWSLFCIFDFSNQVSCTTALIQINSAFKCPLAKVLATTKRVDAIFCVQVECILAFISFAAGNSLLIRKQILSDLSHIFCLLDMFNSLGREGLIQKRIADVRLPRCPGRGGEEYSCRFCVEKLRKEPENLSEKEKIGRTLSKFPENFEFD